MKKIKMTKHKAMHCPVSLEAKVIYRTKFDDRISHVHLPIEAGKINWGTRCSIGRIHEFAVVG